jgi:hypothetical protein
MIKIIKTPRLKIIKTLPSTLGNIDYHIVIYDESILGANNHWNELKEAEVADWIYEKAVYQDIYVIHSTSTRGEKITPISNFSNGFSSNRINCDSILSYHFLATKYIQQHIHIRTGFHENSPEHSPSLSINNWESMSKISNGFHELKLDKNQFISIYQEQIQLWNKQFLKLV